MTRVDLINHLLILVGLNPNDVETTDAEYTTAQEIIDRVTDEVLAMGWAFNTSYGENGPTINIQLDVDRDINFSLIPEHIKPVIKAKASYDYMMAISGENQFTQELFQNYQVQIANAKQTEIVQQTESTSYETILENVRTQLLNETGWWFNTTEDFNGSLITDTPTTLPAIVEQYAEAKAKRIYRATLTNNIDLLLNPSPEERELYGKMLEVHTQNVRGSKGLYRLKQEVKREILIEGWDFNTKIGKYKDLRLAGNLFLKVKAMNPRIVPVIDNENPTIIYDSMTNEEIGDDEKIRVVIDVGYDDLPLLFQSYVDLKASRLYNFYNTPDGVKWAQPTSDEIMLYRKIKAVYKAAPETYNRLKDSFWRWR